MKTPRLLITVLAAVFTAAFASGAGDKPAKKPSESACECSKDKEGMECGVDKDCCCTGKKAEKKD